MMVAEELHALSHTLLSGSSAAATGTNGNVMRPPHLPSGPGGAAAFREPKRTIEEAEVLWPCRAVRSCDATSHSEAAGQTFKHRLRA